MLTAGLSDDSLSAYIPAGTLGGNSDGTGKG